MDGFSYDETSLAEGIKLHGPLFLGSYMEQEDKGVEFTAQGAEIPSAGHGGRPFATGLPGAHRDQLRENQRLHGNASSLTIYTLNTRTITRPVYKDNGNKSLYQQETWGAVNKLTYKQGHRTNADTSDDNPGGSVLPLLQDTNAEGRGLRYETSKTIDSRPKRRLKQ
ncbi:hypothetical protein FQR65_LT17357 [Abscondita terminalis]|nr:hypothetical protein FQR65_LT17357 [Abscondita terminalis]